MIEAEFEQWKQDAEPALQSKLEELHYMGYESVTIEEIWQCVMAKAKKKKEEPRLHKLVGLILSLTVNDVMNWLTIKAYTEESTPLL
ncbi:post-transcriptional regulator [Fictibacillus iocasae]|uniref:Post-transcriptional regulator n=1 Tax=Fictibacillus iocasae TaxID=2715437 RepID=A0ABW2NPA5_9BACL